MGDRAQWRARSNGSGPTTQVGAHQRAQGSFSAEHTNGAGAALSDVAARSFATLGRSEGMSRQDWFRQTEWSDATAAAFFERLARSRSAFHRAQYLRIQALTLANTETPENIASALDLLETIFLQYPDEFDVPMAHLQAARCHDALGNLEAAARHFEAAVEARSTQPNVDTGVAVEYPWFIVRHGLVDRYARALEVLAGAQAVLPYQLFRESAARALIAAYYGEHSAAQASARAAIDAANLQRSPFPRHPGIGLVNSSDRAWLARLAALVSA